MKLVDGHEVIEHAEVNAEDREFIRILIDYIEDAEEVKPKRGEWIPCSERLPEDEGRYYVTRHDDVTNTEFIDILWYEENLWWNRHSTGDYAVTAWMPLPEPWKGADDE